jgi:hypothetical protein
MIEVNPRHAVGLNRGPHWDSRREVERGVWDDGGMAVTVLVLFSALSAVSEIMSGGRAMGISLLRSVGRSVRRGQWGVCPECRQGVERICRAITKQVQRSDARIKVDVMHTGNECTE